MKDITSVAVAQVMLPDIRDYKDDKRQPEPRIDRLIYMADLLEQLPEGKFDLSQWESCICAWTIHVAGQTHRPLADINPIHVARLWLGVPLDDATRLFHPDLSIYGDVTAKQASRVIRHYADTGKVNWSVAALEGVPAKAETPAAALATVD